jgi:hypothetical protein
MNNLSGLMLTIERTNNALLSNSSISANPAFRQYITQFNAGKYFFFRAQGYLEALTRTKCYSKSSICYWLTSLLYPSSTRLNQAMNSFQTFSTGFGTSNAEVNRLKGVLAEFRRQLSAIIQATRTYGITC